MVKQHDWKLATILPLAGVTLLPLAGVTYWKCIGCSSSISSWSKPEGCNGVVVIEYSSNIYRNTVLSEDCDLTLCKKVIEE